MNRKNTLKILIAVMSGTSTALGQSFLLQILFPDFMTTHGLDVLLSLLFFNSGAAGLILFFNLMYN